MKTTLLIPTLNEINGMKAIMPQIKKEWCDQILILDGNSTDGTAEWARENGYEVYLHKQGANDHGGTGLHKKRPRQTQLKPCTHTKPALY